MDWPFGDGEDSEESRKERLGTFVRVATTFGAILFGVVGFDRLENLLIGLEAAIPTATIGSGVAVSLLAVAAAFLCVVLVAELLAWYRLPDPPA